jgi:uncharacterized protein
MDSTLTLPLSSGIGLKPQHFTEAIQAKSQQLSQQPWFEVHPENYLMAGGPLLHGLTQIREQFALSLHSVGMSPGSADGVNVEHVRRIKALCDRLQPALVSDHLAWTRWQQHALNDLLPIPYSEMALTTVCNNLDHIQSLLGRSIAIENPSLYLALPNGDYDEAEFLVQLAKRTDCRLLLDLNNLIVNSNNIGLDASAYLRQIPPALVAEYHLAGHKVEQLPEGVLCIDDHGSPVSERVWQLYNEALQVIGPRPTLLEWDTNVPEFSVLQTEAAKATACMQRLSSKQLSTELLSTEKLFTEQGGTMERRYA